MAQRETEPRKASIPYISYPTFKSFMVRMAAAIPARIDRSILSSMSGAGQTQLLSTLRALDLIDAAGVPTSDMEPLAQAFLADDKDMIRDMLQENYLLLFQGFSLGTATSRILVERFEEQGLSGDTVRKAISFFLAAAKDAGLQVSPHIKAGKAHRPASKGGGARRAAKPASRPEAPGAQRRPMSAPTNDWAGQLLEKFPSFDPSWDPAVQTKWMETFKQLMDMKPAPAEPEEMGGEEEDDEEGVA